MPTDYNNTTIYCLKHKDDHNNENCYIGSTSNVQKRKNKHHSDCYNQKSKNYNSKLYQYIRNNGGWIEWVLYTLEKYPCNNKRECENRERFWYDKMKCTLNNNRPFLYEGERYTYQNNEQYRNRQKILLRQRYKDDSEYRLDKICKALKQYHNNREEIKAKNLARYYRKKNDINEYPLT